MEEEEKITLDKKSFRALISETRINILKSLTQRRKTLSELSKEFGMSVSTIKEHLNVLCSAELIVQKDEGHKWKYYELTGKGRNVLNPGERKIIVLLGISLFAMAGIAGDMFARFYSPRLFLPQNALEKTDVLVGASATPTAEAVAIPYLHIIGIAVFAVIFGVCLFLYFKKR
jgi:DNA-binding transcriptional ArsR family regulator